MLDLREVRDKLGRAWGLGRPLTRVELARAIRLSEKNGGDYIGRLEKAGPIDGGPMEAAIEGWLDGGKPRNMADLITPGYPKGPVK